MKDSKPTPEPISEQEEKTAELPTPTETPKPVLNETVVVEGTYKAVAAPVVRAQQDSTAVVVQNNALEEKKAEESHPTPPTSQRSVKDDRSASDALKNHVETIVE